MPNAHRYVYPFLYLDTSGFRDPELAERYVAYIDGLAKRYRTT